MRRPCARCHVGKGDCAYDKPTARRCRVCTEAMRPPCRSCGERVPMARTSAPRTYCDDPACQAAARSAAGLKGAEVRRPRKTKMCPACGKRKPLTGEHWYIGERRVDGYCRPCKRVDHAVRYATNERRQASARARAKAQRDAIRERRAADPAFDAEYRVRVQGWSAGQRAKRRGERGAVRVSGDDGGHLPVAPLVGAIERMKARRFLTTEALCAELEISPKNYTEWRRGARESVQLDVADKVMTRLGLNWFDPLDAEGDPETYARYEAAFG